MQVSQFAFQSLKSNQTKNDFNSLITYSQNSHKLIFYFQRLLDSSLQYTRRKPQYSGIRNCMKRLKAHSPFFSRKNQISLLMILNQQKTQGKLPVISFLTKLGTERAALLREQVLKLQSSSLPEETCLSGAGKLASRWSVPISTLGLIQPTLVDQLSIIQLFQIMNKNWEEELDFQEDETNNKNKRVNDKKSKKSGHMSTSFEGLDVEEKNIKLPVINAKVVSNNEKSNKNVNRFNLQEINSKRDKKGKIQQTEQLEEVFEESLAPPTSSLKPNPKEPQQKTKVKTETLKEQKNEESVQEYGNQNFEEPEYGDDFQVHQQKKDTPISNKVKQHSDEVIKKGLNTIDVTKKFQKRKAAQSVMKKTNNSLGRVYTRNSARSQDKSLHSRTKIQQKKQDPANKYTNIAERSCANYERTALEEMNTDKIAKENEKIRNTIKRFNDQLNDMINRNILLLKDKKEEKVVPQDQIIKQLQQLKISNQTVLQTTIKDLAKLKEKEVAFRQEGYHLTLEQRIQQSKTSITDLGKTITKLKFDISNQGNKLSKKDKDKDSKQSNPNTQINNVKLSLINIKKDEEKYQETNLKLQAKLQELAKKMAEVEAKFNQQVQGAKLKGISIASKPQLVKKLEEVKKKVDIARQHKSKTEALFKTKSDIIAHQMDQINTQIKTLQNSTTNCQNSCEQVKEESRKVVQKAKKGGRSALEFINSLESIINQMEKGVNSTKEDADQPTTFSHPKATKKYQSVKNVQKVASISVAEKTQDDPNNKKPLIFLKKKEDDEKAEERVWNKQKVNSPPKSQKDRDPVPALSKFQEKPEVKDQQKKKPFVFKKNKDKLTQEQPKIQNPKPETVKEDIKRQDIRQQQAKKVQEAASVAPKMMKFKKNKQQIAKQAKIVPQNDKNIEINPTKQVFNTVPQKVQQKVEEQEKAIFVPKRFNLKIKDRKSQEVGYIASNVQKKEETKFEESRKSGLPLNKEDKKQVQKEKTAQSKPETSEEKPQFNIKLKDKRKQQNRQQVKEEEKTQSKEQSEQPFKIPITLMDDPNPLKENNNPYAKQQGLKRERQGPIKKQKPQRNAPKEQFSVFQQADQIQL